MKSSRHNTLFGLLAFTLIPFCACEQESAQLQAVTSKSAPIIGGMFAGGSKEAAEKLASNGTIVRMSTGGRCTGTMLAGGWILTLRLKFA